MVTWIDSAKQLVDIIIETQNIPDEFNEKVEIKTESKALIIEMLVLIYHEAQKNCMDTMIEVLNKIMND